MADEEKKRSKVADEKILERARKRWKAADEAESDNRKKQADDMKFAAASPDDNYQWPDDVLKFRQNKDQEGGARPCLTINKLPTHIRQVTNEQRMNRPQIRVQPVDDLADPEVADVFNGVIRHIQVASEADLAYDKACDPQVAAGEGFFRVLTEYCDEMSFDQDIVIAPIVDRFKVYMDPIGLMAHPAGRKCQWGFIIEDLPKEDYEADYGDEYPIDWNMTGTADMMDWFPSKETVRIAEYFEIEKKPVTLLQWQRQDGSFAVSIEGEALPDGVTVVEQPVNKRKTKLPKCIWYKINGQHIIDEREMPTKYIPIVRVVGNEWVIEGKLVVSGLVRNAKDGQRMYNYNASLEVELNALAPKSPITGMAEQIEGHEDKYRTANTVNHAFLPYNAVYDDEGKIVNVAAPSRMLPAMPQQAVIAAKLAAADDIKATTGQFDPSLGNNPQAKSGVALQREQVKTEVGTFHYVDNLARALRYAGTIIVDMIPKVYSGKRIARILGEDGEPDHVVLDPSIAGPKQDVYAEGDKEQKSAIGKVYNLGVGKYDVVVSTGPSFTTKRQEAAEFLTNAIQSSKDPQMAAVLTYLSLKANDWAGADEAVDLIKRLPVLQGILPPEGEDGQAELPPAAKQMIDQLKHAVGQMKGQLDTATQALTKRDETLKELKGKLDGKNVEAMAKMYEADKKAMAEIEKARAEVLVARAEAATALAEQPENNDLKAVVTALTQTVAQMDQKLGALEQSSNAIATQLQTFEIAARMPQQQPQGAAA